ncbi:MAG: hypothetical protein MJZ66_05730 [Bacteroidales bacterium]|nr:hypothetical protein [Bacteroidales bacterium]
MKEITNEEQFYEWKCMKIQEPSDFETFVKQNNIIGRKVTGMKFVGINFDTWRYDSEILQSVEIDEPFMFQFEDGSHWDIDYSRDSLIYTAINGLPKETDSYMGNDNEDRINVDEVFSYILGTSITNVIVNHIPIENFVPEFLYNEEDNQKECFSEIRIEFSNGCVIKLSNFYDYGWVMLEKPYHGQKPKCAYRHIEINFGRKKRGYIRGKIYTLYINIEKKEQGKGRLAHNKNKAEYMIVGKFLNKQRNKYIFGHVAVFERK